MIKTSRERGGGGEVRKERQRECGRACPKGHALGESHKSREWKIWTTKESEQ